MEYRERERSPTLHTLQREKSATRSFLPAREREPRSTRARPRSNLASHVTVADNCIPFAQGVAALVTRRFPPFLYHGLAPRDYIMHIKGCLIHAHTKCIIMCISLRARAEVYKVAMPLLGPPEKLQLLKWNMYFDAGCTCLKESLTVIHPEQIR